MSRFDRKIRHRIKEMKVPQSYYDRVDGTLKDIRRDTVKPPKKRFAVHLAAIAAVICLVLTGSFLFGGTEVAQATFFGDFRENILQFLGIQEKDSENTGVRSEKENAVSKPDLMMELKEVVVDRQSIYAIVKVTAPASVTFDQDMTFDYYGFCKGSNYNVSEMLSGAKGCSVLEILPQKKNVATFVVNMVSDDEIAEGAEVSVFLKDLIKGPPSNNPEVLVEGMWTLSFTANHTSTKEVVAKGTEKNQYSLLGKKVTIKKAKLRPLGMTILLDMSEIPIDILNTSDTRVTIKLRMLDGSETLVESPEPDVRGLTNESSISIFERKGRVYHKYVSQFEEAINIDQVLGICIGDGYLSLKGEESYEPEATDIH